jgi:hypothetical protein
MLRAGQNVAARLVTNIEADSPLALDEAATARLAELLQYEQASESRDNQLEVVRRLESHAFGWSDAASRRIRELLDDAPELRLTVQAAMDWFMGRPVAWQGFDPVGRTWVQLTDLPSAHQRLARFAIASTTPDAPPPYSFAETAIDEASILYEARRHRRELSRLLIGDVALIDEPERGLHSIGQRQLASKMSLLADRVVGASHSSAFIDLHDHVLHVQRDSSGIRLAPLVAIARRGLESSWARELGLTSTELIQLVRVIVLVEGVHDVTVIGGLLSEKLGERRAWLLSLDGTRDLAHVAEARWLFELSEASIVVIVDDLDAPGLVKGLGELSESVRGQRKDSRGRLARLRNDLNAGGGGGRVLATLIGAAFETNQLHRLSAYGLRRKDIVEYLPVSAFTKSAVSWADLFSEYSREAHGTVSGRGYKDWLKRRGVRVDRIGLERVVREINAGGVALSDEAREELENVISLIADVSKGATGN